MSTPVAGARPRVLLVDDEPSIRAVYPEVLGVDFDVVVAANGTAALELLRRDTGFDVIVCDLSMPGLDGPALYAELQASAPQLLDRIIFCSGGLVNDRLREFSASIPNVFLDKPMRVETLGAAIEELAARRAPHSG